MNITKEQLELARTFALNNRDNEDHDNELKAVVEVLLSLPEKWVDADIVTQTHKNNKVIIDDFVYALELETLPFHQQVTVNDFLADIKEGINVPVPTFDSSVIDIHIGKPAIHPDDGVVTIMSDKANNRGLVRILFQDPDSQDGAGYVWVKADILKDVE